MSSTFSPWITKDDLRGLLEGFAPEPMAGWSDWFRRTHHDWVHDPRPAEAALGSAAEDFDICMPAPFVPTGRDLTSPLQPTALLRVDWETNGWATELKSALGQIEFIPVEASPWRLGLFDHDATSRVHTQEREALVERLQELGLHAHRGMVRLWVDLQRNRVEEQRFDMIDARRKDGIDETLRQSLEVLGELLVRPLIDEGQRADEEARAPSPRAHRRVGRRGAAALGALRVLARPGARAPRRGQRGPRRAHAPAHRARLHRPRGRHRLAPAAPRGRRRPEELRDPNIHDPDQEARDGDPMGCFAFASCSTRRPATSSSSTSCRATATAPRAAPRA